VRVYSPTTTLEFIRGLLSSFETSVSLVEMFLMNEDLVERLRNRLDSNNLGGGGGGGGWAGMELLKTAVPGLVGN
jgi:hypothetical protein